MISPSIKTKADLIRATPSQLGKLKYEPILSKDVVRKFKFVNVEDSRTDSPDILYIKQYRPQRDLERNQILLSESEQRFTTMTRLQSGESSPMMQAKMDQDVILN